MENTQNAGSTSGSAESNATSFMADLLQKLGGPEEAMKAFAMFTSMMGKTTPATTTTAPPPQVSETVKPQPEVVHSMAEPVTSVARIAAANVPAEEAGLAAGLKLLAVGEPRLDHVSEGETSAIITVGVSEGVAPVIVAIDVVERETRVVSEGVDVSEGETPVIMKIGEGETPGICEEVSEGETLKYVEGKEALSPEKAMEGETLERVGAMMKGRPLKRLWILRSTMNKIWLGWKPLCISRGQPLCCLRREKPSLPKRYRNSSTTG